MRKTFVSVFLAILAAVAVIGGIALLASPILHYRNNKQICMSEISAAYRYRPSAGSLKSQLDRLQEAGKQARETEAVLLALFERKPYGLPLTSEERQIAADIKERHRIGDLKALRAGLRMYKTEYGDYPDGEPADVFKKLDRGNKNHLEFYTGPTADHSGKPYPVTLVEVEQALGASAAE